MEPSNFEKFKQKLSELISNIYNKFLSSKNKNDGKNIQSAKERKEIIIKKIKETEIKYEKKIKEENDKFAKKKETIIKEKKESIRLIENNAKSKIDENNKKHRNLLSYLDSIQGDKEKLIEFFQNNNSI